MPEDSVRIGGLVKRVFEGEFFSNIDIYFRLGDGSVRSMLSRLYPVYGNDGRVIACLFANTDVTERKLLEEDLRAEREIFSILLDFDKVVVGLEQGHVMSHALMFMTDRLGIDRASIALLSKDGKEFIVTDVTDASEELGKGTAIPADNTALSDVVRTGAPLNRPDIGNSSARYGDDDVLLRKGIRSSFLTPLIIGGECIGTLNMGASRVDGIPEEIRRIAMLLAPRLSQALMNARLFETLGESETRYRDLFENANDAIFIVDSEMRYIEANRKATELFGYSREEFLSMSILDVIPPEQVSRSGEEFGNLFRSGNYEKFVGKMRTRDGQHLDVEVSSSAIIRDGKVIGTREVVRDITNKKKWEEEDIKSQKLESIGLLAGGLAHDFNNLLTGVLGNISLAKMALQKNEKAYRRLEEAEKASLRASDITRQLLTFAKGGDPVKEAVSIGEVVRESAIFALRGSNVGCDFVIPSDSLMVDADGGQISQVIHNLVINAVQAMPEGGVIKVTCDDVVINDNEIAELKAGNYVKITIRDSGTGISNEDVGKIFDPYFTTKQGGSGLGLSVVYSVMKKHGGHVSVESSPGSGTTFHLFLPSSTGSSSGNKMKAATSEPRSGRGRILMVDDEEVVRDVAGTMLLEFGYDVAFAEDGAEALVLYREAIEGGTPFHAVIMDLTIPGGMGGKETMGKLLKIDPDARVIVSSGYSNDLLIADYALYGFCGVLTKPYTPRELSEKVFEAINGS